MLIPSWTSIQQRQPPNQPAPSLWYKRQWASSNLLCSEMKTGSSVSNINLPFLFLACPHNFKKCFLSEDKSALHRSLLILVTKRGNVLWGEEVSVHAVNPCEVVNVSSVVEQVAGLIREEVSINHRRQKKVFHSRIWGEVTRDYWGGIL